MEPLQELKIMKLKPNAVLPVLATEGAAGLDLTAISLNMDELDPDTSYEAEYSKVNYKFTYGTGLAFEIPKGYVGLIFPRSSIHKTGMMLTNCVGIIDADYRGEVKFVFTCRSDREKLYEIGDRVGQLVLMKLPKFFVSEVTELSETDRGTGGFGSTGR